MRKRAENVDETRQRIIEATVRLHGTVGPARTSIAAIAAEAGVTRLTVYRHFTDEAALIQACNEHWLAQRVPPDPQAWSRIPDPGERLAVGLADLYRFYRGGQDMLALARRDWDHLPRPQREALAAVEAYQVQVLLDPFPVPGDRQRRLRAVIAHAAGFPTWQSLCVVNGLSDQEAVDVMSALVRLAAEGPPSR